MTAQRQTNDHEASTATNSSGHSVGAPTTMPRRQFLRVTSLAGAVALLGGACALRGALEAQPDPSPVPGTPEITAQALLVQKPTPNASTPSADSSPCVPQCPARCAYPGLCRRYADANQNGLCDNGECA